MLGYSIDDPQGMEGVPGSVQGLGHLDVKTTMAPLKHLSQKTGVHPASNAEVTGYEIHIGETTGPDTTRAWLQFGNKPEGAASPNGRIQGCYMHGLFNADTFRAAFLAQFGVDSCLDFEVGVDETLDALADHIEQYFDLDLMLSLAGDVVPPA